MPGPLVETGSVVARECEAGIPAGEVFGDGDEEGDGEGEGETTGDGEGAITRGCDAATGSTAVELCDDTVACRRWLKP